MLRVRTVDEVDDFLLPDDSGKFTQFVRGAWEEGISRPEWCFVIGDGTAVAGRVGFTLEPTTSDPAWRGTLPPSELHTFGLWWEGSRTIAKRLLTQSLTAMSDVGPEHAEIRINRRSTPRHVEAVALLGSMGAPLFQEKAGFELGGSTAVRGLPDRLTWSTVEDIGVEQYGNIMGRCGHGTLDRNDQYYWGHCGPDNWGRQMMEYLDPGDADMWLVGSAQGRPVGYVSVVTDPELVSTIGHVGVLPEARGHGYGHDLLVAASATMTRRGIRSMLSDVDVLNQPMIEAMRRAGHRDSDWHIWHHRPQLA